MNVHRVDYCQRWQLSNHSKSNRPVNITGLFIPGTVVHGLFNEHHWTVLDYKKQFACNGKQIAVHMSTRKKKTTTNYTGLRRSAVTTTQSSAPYVPRRLRRICLTLHDWTDAEYKAITELDCTWMVIGKEHCPDTGRPHLQGGRLI